MHRVFLERKAEKDLDGLPGHIREAAIKAIVNLEHNPRPAGSKKLKSEIRNWRLRISDYRILYEIDDRSKTVLIYRIKHRKEAYR
ncbi:MAG: type II toxin-antitoxin system RelE/ParE family toxin [Elusimicrobia bacterium]|nr:type II toxin-antitoxin system RelE/ParE family toxin [Elusimicrobiota bacterium]